jgi:O-antigen/teichoic acid export membrane protein
LKNKKRRLLRDLVSLCSGEIAGKIAGFIAFAYLARTLEPDLYGAVELAVAVSIFFMLIIDFGYGSIGAREVSKDSSIANLIAARIVSARLLLALLTIPLMGITGLLIAETPHTRILIWWFALALFAIPWDHRWLFQGLERMNVVALGQTIRMIAFAIAVMIFVHSANDYWLVGVAEVLSTLLMATFFIALQYYYIGKVGFDFNLKHLQTLSKQTASIGLSNAIWAAGQYAPTVLVATLASMEQLAWFAAAHRIAMSMIAFSLIYHFSLFPSVSKRLKSSLSDFNDFVYPSIKVAAWIGIGCALLVLLGSEYFFVSIFGKEFTQAADVMNVLIWALPITLLSGHARWALIAAGHQRSVFHAQTCGFITTIIVCLILVPVYHAKGGAIAMVLSTLTVWIMAHFSAQRHIGQLPFFEATLRPLLMAAFSLYIFSLINTPWLGIISALIIYILGALLIDWKLPGDIHTLISIKDGESSQTIEKEGKHVNKRIVLSFLCMVLALVIFQIKPFPIANWLNAETTELHLNIVTRDIVFFKYLLEADIIIALALMWLLFKSTNAPDSPYHSLWKSRSLHQDHSIYETYFFPLLYGILLLALLFQTILPGITLWSEEILTLFDYLKFNFGEPISHYANGDQQIFFSLFDQIIVGLFGKNDFSFYLPDMVIRVACIWATARLVRYIFNAQKALIIAILFATFSQHDLLLQNKSGYALVFFGTVLATELFLRNLETGKWRYGLGYAFLIAATSWLYIYTIFIALAHTLIYLISAIRTPNWSKNNWRPFWVLILSAWITLHFYAPFLPGVDGHLN